MKAWPRVVSGLDFIIEHPAIAKALVEMKESYFPNSSAEIEHWRALLDAVMDAHIFEFDDDTVRLMELTDNEPHEVRLPFPLTFLDADFEVSVGKIRNRYSGLLLYEYEAPPFSVEEYGQIGKSEIEYPVPGRHTSAVAFIRDTGKPYVIDVFYPISVNPAELFAKALHGKAKVTFHRYGQGEWKAMRNIALNFLDLLDTPDAYIVPIRRGSKNTARRKREGKVALPPSDMVYLRPSIRRYINDLKAFGAWDASHRFWVRGHFRHYRDERYRNILTHQEVNAHQSEDGPRIGKCSSCFGKEFIKPFIKGKGFLVKKRYRERTANA